MGDLFGRMGSAQGASAFRHACQAVGSLEKASHFEGGVSGVGELRGGTHLQQILRIPLLMTRDGIDDQKGASAGERLGAGQSTGLADDEVNGLHHLRNVFNVAEHADAFTADSRSGHAAAQAFVAPKHDERLAFGKVADERFGEFDGWPDAEATGQEERGGASGEKPVAAAQGVRCMRLRERGAHRDSGDVNRVGVLAAANELTGCLITGSEVAGDVAAAPQSVDVKVRDHTVNWSDGDLGCKFEGKKMGADDSVRALDTKAAAKRAGCSTAEQNAEPAFPWALRCALSSSIHVAPEFGSGADKVQVAASVCAVEPRRGVVEDVAHLRCGAAGGKGLGESAGSNLVPGTGRCVKDQDFHDGPSDSGTIRSDKIKSATATTV